ncbi:MAG: hypothetical protein AUH79_02510 [Betaproteobacteria bacterium 13_1_40CM_4_64_4]|nr:MAG: hypothetical protein AUH79_02510 [Betaproteobacteria bacterium 13_1_40CM_4_64_4]
MSLPPFALAAALAFWGWRSSHYGAAAVLALLAEGPRYLRARFELQHGDFARVADLCSVLFVAVVGWLFLSLEAPRTARAVLTAMLWLPAVLSPILLAQRLSPSGMLPLSALFRYLRKLRARDPNYRETELDFAPIYFAICLVAAGIPNERDAYFYVGVVLVAAWALAATRPAHARLGVWSCALAAAAVLGYAAHAGLGQAQAALEDWVSDWYLGGMASNPYRSTTDLGSVGRLKMIDSIVLRVYREPRGSSAPGLLHRASFTTLEGNTWIARRAPMAALQPLADGTSWEIAPGSAQRRTRMFIRLEGGKAVLALPAGTVRLSDMAAVLVRHNALGAVQAEFGGDWAPYTADSEAAAGGYAPPGDADLLLPPRERATLERVARDLAFQSGDALARVREHFAGFRYSTYREAALPRGRTALEDFLLHSKSGHCEYFAAATTLLLRAAGIPARYATGFAVYEYSKLEQAYVVRTRHAHAWARAYVDGRWIDIDTTPPSWIEEEERSAPKWQQLVDFLRWAEFRWAQRGALEVGIGWASVLVPLLLFFGWSLLRGKRVAAQSAQAGALRRFAGAHSEFYAVAARLPARAPHESLAAWLARIAPALDLPVREALAQAKALHDRYRFDPRGIDAAERRALHSDCLALAARLPLD